MYLKLTLSNSLANYKDSGFPDIYTVLTAAAPLIISSDKEKAAELCINVARYIQENIEYWHDYIISALAYIIAGELIKETSTTEADKLFKEADNQELKLLKAMTDPNIWKVWMDCSTTYEKAALCLKYYTEKEAEKFQLKAAKFKKYAEEEISQSHASDED